MTLAVVGAVQGRPSNSLLSERLERAREVNSLLRMENRALRAEHAGLADELIALSRRIDLAITAERPDVASHVAGRIYDLAQSLSRRGDIPA